MRQHTQRPDGLLALIQQAREHYEEPPPGRKRGRPRAYTGLSSLSLAVTAVALRTFKGAELHRLLCRDEGLRQALGFHAVPHHHRAPPARVAARGRSTGGDSGAA